MGKGSRRHRSANNNKRKAKMQTYPSEGPMPAMRDDPVTAELERIYGKYGPPAADDEVNANPRVIDLLGRVNNKTFIDDEIPDFLRNPAVTDNPQPNKDKARRVSIFKDHALDYPALCLKIFVQPDPAVPDDEARFAKMFARAACRRAASLGEADLVVFAGGSDVDPVLYNEKPHPYTHFSTERDQTDMDLYLFCIEHGIPMFGVCRGAQFLHVMNGGKLWQHVDNHYGPHGMFDIVSYECVEKVSSVHHQMVRENVRGGMEIIATASKSKERFANPTDKDIGNNADIEAFYYRETGCLGVQGHPEYEGYNYFTIWCLKMIDTYICLNPDFDWNEDGFLRMTKEAKDATQLANLPDQQQEQPLLLTDTSKEK